MSSSPSTSEPPSSSSSRLRPPIRPPPSSSQSPPTSLDDLPGRRSRAGGTPGTTPCNSDPSNASSRFGRGKQRYPTLFFVLAVPPPSPTPSPPSPRRSLSMDWSHTIVGAQFAPPPRPERAPSARTTRRGRRCRCRRPRRAATPPTETGMRRPPRRHAGRWTRASPSISPPAADRSRRFAPPPPRTRPPPSSPRSSPPLPPFLPPPTLPEQNLVHVAVQSVLPVPRTSVAPNLDARGIGDVGEATCQSTTGGCDLTSTAAGDREGRHRRPRSAPGGECCDSRRKTEDRTYSPSSSSSSSSAASPLPRRRPRRSLVVVAIARRSAAVPPPAVELRPVPPTPGGTRVAARGTPTGASSITAVSILTPRDGNAPHAIGKRPIGSGWFYFLHPQNQQNKSRGGGCLTTSSP